jgi:hypothetical protein
MKSSKWFHKKSVQIKKYLVKNIELKKIHPTNPKAL